MTKSHAEFVESAYKHIIDDACISLPISQKDARLDKKRVHLILEENGIRPFMVDFPNACKVLDKALCSERLDTSGLPFFGRTWKHTAIPRLFRGLWLRIFSEDGDLLSPPCHESIRFLRQLLLVFKKYRLDSPPSALYKAVAEYDTVECALPQPTLRWNDEALCSDIDSLPCFADRLSLSSSQDHADPCDDNGTSVASNGLSFTRAHRWSELQRVADIVCTTIGPFHPMDWKMKHGPGAVSDSKASRKYDFPHWSDRLESAFPYDVFAFANHSMWTASLTDKFEELPTQRSDFSSKLIAVPKTLKGPRLIASEPTSHQWCQQSIKNFFMDRVRHTFLGKAIDFNDQSHNQRRARQASIDSDSWTVDLSSASDRLSCWVVERFLRRNLPLLDALHACRTTSVTNQLDKKTRPLIPLRKFSTMGSAITFPIQSIWFLTAGITAVLLSRGIPCSPRSVRNACSEVRVFGDDIVIPSDCGSELEVILESLWFKVNQDKTFRNGKFRESCGSEFFDGYDVSAIYLLSQPVGTRPESIASSVDTQKNLFKRGLLCTADWLMRTAQSEVRFKLPIVAVGSGAFGWAGTFTDWSHLKSRYNRSLQRTEVLTYCIKNTVRKLFQRGTSSLLQYFVDAPRPQDPWRHGAAERPSPKIRAKWVPIYDLAES